MKRFCVQLLSIGYFFIAFLQADSPGTTTLFSPSLTNGIEALQFSAYNSQQNLFVFSWLDEFSNIDAVLLDTSGNQIGSQKTIFNLSSSSPSACYNSQNNQYFITWIAETPTFSIVDSLLNTVVGPIGIDISPDLVISADVFCCYNSVNNQYCITWTAQNSITLISNTYFALINSDGTIALSETQIPNVSDQVTSDFTDSFVTYNSTNNQYFFTWIGVDGSTSNVVFAIYDASGNSVILAKVIPQTLVPDSISYPIFSCYNSVNNQYFITWSTFGNGQILAMFAIYDSSGNSVVSATEIASLSSLTTPVCSYNMRNNQYFVTWNNNNTDANYSIFTYNGNLITENHSLPLLPSGAPASIVFNSFSSTDDKYFITWYPTNQALAYFNIFTTNFPNVIPPTNFKGEHELNRFANYGEYFNKLRWRPTSSPNIKNYDIYENGLLVATLSPSTTTYTVHNQPNIFITYSIQAVNIFGDASPIISITI